MMKGGRPEGGSEGKKNISPRSVPLRMSASSPSSPQPRPPALSSSLFFFSPLLSPCCLPSSHFLISHIMRSFPRSGMYHSYNATGTATRQYEHANCGYMASTSSLTFSHLICSLGIYQQVFRGIIFSILWSSVIESLMQIISIVE